MREQSCFDCKHASIDGGFPGNREQPPEPACLADCKCKEITSEFIEKYSGSADMEIMLARHCHHFDPILISNCENCGLKMDVARCSWELWAVCYEEIPCCSHLCKEQLQFKIDSEIGKRLEDSHE